MWDRRAVDGLCTEVYRGDDDRTFSHLYEAAVPESGVNLEDSLSWNAVKGTLEQDTACRAEKTILRGRGRTELSFYKKRDAQQIKVWRNFTSVEPCSESETCSFCTHLFIFFLLPAWVTCVSPTLTQRELFVLCCLLASLDPRPLRGSAAFAQPVGASRLLCEEIQNNE